MNVKCSANFKRTRPARVTNLATMIFLLLATFLVPAQRVLAQAEIHKCPADDGSVVYQQLPCADKAQQKAIEPAAPNAERPAAAPPKTDQPREPAVSDSAATEARDDAEVAACRQRYRDAIDRIDAEIAAGIDADEAEEYRGRARALSQALSRC